MGRPKLDNSFQVVKEFTVGGRTYRPGDSIKTKKLKTLNKVQVLLNQRFIAPQPNV